jgi:riboflavin synthase
MFTGLITDIGEVVSIDGTATELIQIQIRSNGFKSFTIGESIACDGVCLTVTRFDGSIFQVDAAPETLRRTVIGHWKAGRKVNLEKALAAGDRLGGHLVQGHVDGVTRIVERRMDGGTVWFSFELPKELLGMVVEKGSICIDGISLTVSAVYSNQFSVMLIPETVLKTTLGTRILGDQVNLEVDIIGKYVANMFKLRFP